MRKTTRQYTQIRTKLGY